MDLNLRHRKLVLEARNVRGSEEGEILGGFLEEVSLEAWLKDKPTPFPFLG